MTDGFRTDKRFLAALIVVPALLSASAGAAELRVAQDGPVRLMPRRDWTTPVPLPTQPATPGTSAPGQTPADQPPPDIQIKDLGSVDPEAVGILDASNGGFSAGMWAGTPRATIRRLIGAIPDDIHSPVMRSLADRLLLTAAALPPADGEAEKAEDGTVLALRAGRLQAMGLVDRSKALIVASPLRSSDPALIRLLVENMLLGNDLGGACDESRRQGDRLTSTFWQRLTVFCQILSGENEAAQLGANVLRRQGFPDPGGRANAEYQGADRLVAVAGRASPGDAAQCEPAGAGRCGGEGVARRAARDRRQPEYRPRPPAPGCRARGPRWSYRHSAPGADLHEHRVQ